MKIYVYTLGCRVNQCESEAIAEAFMNSGHEVLHSAKGADLVLVNTCTVTSKEEQKARRMIRLFAQDSITLVTGCYAQVNPSEIEALSDNVLVVPLMRKPELLNLPAFIEEHRYQALMDIMKDFVKAKPATKTTLFDFAPSQFSYHSRSYLKIQDGCDNNCGFCRVHIARGPSFSLDADTVVKRALEIEKKGYHEIVLAGVNLTMYDHKGRGLGGLLEKLLAAVGPDMRFRLSSLEPDHIDELLLQQLADPRMQPYFHIPIQSASDKVIKRINRTYDSSHLEYVLTRLRQIKDDPFLACDIITGLPGEDDEEFEYTRDFLQRHGFALMHVFPFSPRPDTALANAKDRSPESIRDQRAKVLRDLSDELNAQYAKRQVGKTNEVILEEHKNGRWYGLTGNYLRVEVKNVPEDYKCGSLCKVVMTDVDCSVFIPEIKIHRFDSLDSTNAVLMQMAREGYPCGTVVWAKSQTLGRGRLGRSFSSPEGGLYISFLLPLKEDALFLTAMAGIAVKRTIKQVCNKDCAIKWVNDIIYNGRKVCGILAQAVGNKVVMGIGVNYAIDLSNLPKEVQEIATSIYNVGEEHPPMEKFAKALTDNIYKLCYQQDKRNWLEEYKNSSTIVGNKVNIIQAGKIIGEGLAKEIDDNCFLHVVQESGEEVVLSTGEVSIRIQND